MSSSAESDLSQRDLKQALVRVGEVFTPFVSSMVRELDRSEDDVARMIVTALGKQLDITRGADTLVLVVRGRVIAYENATQVVVAGGPNSQEFDELASDQN